MGRKKISRYVFQNQVPIEEKLKQVLNLLDLNSSADKLAMIHEKAKKTKISYSHFLDELLEVELHSREDSRLTRWKNQARFPWVKTLEEFNFDVLELKEKERGLIIKDILYDLIDCNWIKRGGNIAFFGPPGIGKTHLSIALGLKAIEYGYETRFITARQLVEMLNYAIEKDEGNGEGENRKRLLNIFTNIPLLILDDLTYSKVESHCTEFLFQLFFGRYDAKKSTIVTGNEGYRAWIDSLFSGDESKTSAVVDRFMEDCERINMQGNSYRISNLRKQSNTITNKIKK